MENKQLHSENWKYSQATIREYFGDILGLASNNILSACRLESARKRNWTIKKLFEFEMAENEEAESKHWFTEWVGLKDFLEKKFSITFPILEEPLVHYVNTNGSYSKKTVYGLDPDISSERLSEIVSILIEDEEIPEEFFWVTVEKITDEVFFVSAPFTSYAGKLTYDILKEMPIESFTQGYCSLKSDSGKFGRILINDAINYKAIIREMDSETILAEFGHFKELIHSGWVVD